MPLVVDASVALKWVLPEPETPQAVALIGVEPLLAPDFLWLECCNVLARDVRRGLMAATAADQALAALKGVPIRLSPLLPRLEEAHVLARALGRTVYDSLYLALALSEGAILVTADRRFAEAAEALHPASVRRL